MSRTALCILDRLLSAIAGQRCLWNSKISGLFNTWVHQNRASPFASDFYRRRGYRNEFRSEDHFYPFSLQKKSRFASDSSQTQSRILGPQNIERFLGERWKSPPQPQRIARFWCTQFNTRMQRFLCLQLEATCLQLSSFACNCVRELVCQHLEFVCLQLELTRRRTNVQQPWRRFQH